MTPGTRPPHPAVWLACLCLPQADADAMLGDLEETYRALDRRYGQRAARRWYWRQVLRSIPHLILRTLYWSLVMMANYLKIALRHFKRQKLYAFVNIVGLAVGLACVILIARYIQYEGSYDRFHEKADRIYRIIQRQPGNNYLGNDYLSVTSAPLAPALGETFPEIIRTTTIWRTAALLGRGDQHFFEDGIYASAAVFDIFTFPLRRGNPATALAEPNSIVLTASLAEKLYGDANPLGTILTYHTPQEEETYTVTGMMDDVPDNAHFTFRFITSIRSNPYYRRDLEDNIRNNNSYHTYLLVREDTDAHRLQAKLPAFTKLYLADGGLDHPNEYYLQALTDIHLHSRFNFDIAAQGDITFIYLFSAIAAVILLLACINYMTLAVARSMKRAREVGLRKVVGAHRSQLVRQFLGESFLLTSLALVLALGLVHLLLPAFSDLVERPLRMDYAENPLLLPGLLVLILLIGLLSGSYPALYLSSLRPAHVLKGSGALPSRKARLQRLLVIGQYTASIALIGGSLVIYQQLRYVENKEMGYDRTQVVTTRVRGPELADNYATLRAELLRNPNVVAVASSSALPIHVTSSTSVTGWEGGPDSEYLSIRRLIVDYDFFDVFGIGLAEGRRFSRSFATDTAGAFLFNRAAVQAFGWDTALDKRFLFRDEEGPVIGVVNDFHMHSLHYPIEPLMIQLGTYWMGYLSVRIRSENRPETLAFLSETTRQFTPYPVEYGFVDEAFDRLYRAELRLGEAFGYVTLLALLIASLGLFGLAAFSAEQRTKEIGIRKVLGASVTGIAILLSNDFLKLILWASVAAAPIAYAAANRWLDDFAYRIEIRGGEFLMAGLFALLVAVLTVSYQAIRAARTDPVKTLRYE